MQERPNTIVLALVCLVLVALAAGSRLAELPPNFTAVGAVALFAGFFFRDRRFAVGVPLAAMLLSDAVIGFYDWPMMAAVYGAIALPALWSATWPGRAGVARIALASAGTGVGFFIITNFVWWLTWSGNRSLAGVIESYVAALPFLKYTLAGNLFFAAVVFGCYETVRRAAAAAGSLKQLPA